MLSNKDFNKVIQFFIRDRKRNISLVFITQFYFAVPKSIRLNSLLLHESSKQTRSSINYI